MSELIATHRDRRIRPARGTGEDGVLWPRLERAFAAELGQHDIRVNSIHPGGVNTPMGSGDMIGAIERAGATNPKLNGMGVPFLERWAAEPEEIADAVLFLASDESKYISALRLSIDGGMAWF